MNQRMIDHYKKTRNLVKKLKEHIYSPYYYSVWSTIDKEESTLLHRQYKERLKCNINIDISEYINSFPKEIEKEIKKIETRTKDLKALVKKGLDVDTHRAEVLKIFMDDDNFKWIATSERCEGYSVPVMLLALRECSDGSDEPYRSSGAFNKCLKNNY